MEGVGGGNLFCNGSFFKISAVFIFCWILLTLHFNSTSHSAVTAKPRYSTKWGPTNDVTANILIYVQGKQVHANKFQLVASYLVSWSIQPSQIQTSSEAPWTLNNETEYANIQHLFFFNIKNIVRLNSKSQTAGIKQLSLILILFCHLVVVYIIKTNTTKLLKSFFHPVSAFIIEKYFFTSYHLQSAPGWLCP